MTAVRTRVAGPRPVRLRQLPGLDGLRAIAVVAVIVYHLDPGWLPGGYLGVDVFFVISGYLITALLLSEHQRTGGVALRRFWARRARRLLPALGVILLAVTLLAGAFARDAVAPLRGDLPASLGYIFNWKLLLARQSYLAGFARPPLLQHLWSLSVEEQFYLLWPPALLLLRRRLTRSQVAAVALGGAAVSAALMAGLYRSADPSAVYFGTHTHAEGLLIGCALAAAVPPWRMTAAVAPAARRLLDQAGLAALALVVVGLASFGFSAPLTYRGGMVLLDLATAAVVIAVAHPASRLGAGLARQPLRWLGLRSYSLYLWHWPIFQLTRPGVDLRWPVLPVDLLRVALTVAGAELTYRYVEQPWREGRTQFALRVRLAAMARYQVATVVAALLAAIALILATAPTTTVDEPAVLAEGSTAAARTVLPPSVIPGPTPPPPDFFTHHDGLPRDWAPPPAPPGPRARSVTAPRTSTRPPATGAPGPAAGTPDPKAEPILAVGDSVMLAASPALTAAFGPQITVDAAVGRQVPAGIARLAQYRRSGALARYRTVVVALGTNGAFTPALFAQMASILAGVPRVVVFDVHASRSWVAASNATVRSGVAADPGQMRLADWAAVAGEPGMLYPDGVHPDGAGAALYTRLLEAAVSR